jgi:hypothetical protein
MQIFHCMWHWLVSCLLQFTVKLDKVKVIIIWFNVLHFCINCHFKIVKRYILNLFILCMFLSCFRSALWKCGSINAGNIYTYVWDSCPNSWSLLLRYIFVALFINTNIIMFMQIQIINFLNMWLYIFYACWPVLFFNVSATNVLRLIQFVCLIF